GRERRLLRPLLAAFHRGGVALLPRVPRGVRRPDRSGESRRAGKVRAVAPRRKSRPALRRRGAGTSDVTAPRSYAHIGEDLRLWRALWRVRRGTYIDVGAHDPEHLSVTKLFYDRGWSGINIEPVPSSFERIARARLRDVNLCVAASDTEGEAVLHQVAGS